MQSVVISGNTENMPVFILSTHTVQQYLTITTHNS